MKLQQVNEARYAGKYYVVTGWVDRDGSTEDYRQVPGTYSSIRVALERGWEYNLRTHNYREPGEVEDQMKRLNLDSEPDQFLGNGKRMWISSFGDQDFVAVSEKEYLTPDDLEEPQYIS